MNLFGISTIRGLVIFASCSLLVSCDNNTDTKFSMSSETGGVKATIKTPWDTVRSRIPLEQLNVAVTFDDRDPIYLDRYGDQWEGSFPFVEPNKPMQLGVTWFSSTMHFATMTREIVFDPSNPVATFSSIDYQHIDSDRDGVTNIIEVGANSDPFDGTVWPDIADAHNNGGLMGSTGGKESIAFIPAAVEQNEDSGSMKFLVVRNGTATIPINVEYETVNRTASEGLDYTSTRGQLSWPVGSHEEHTIEVLVHSDDSVEADEYFLLKFKNTDNPDDTTVFADADFAIGIIQNAGGTVVTQPNDTERLAGWYDASTDAYGVSVNARVRIMPDGTYSVYRILEDCYVESSHSVKRVQSIFYIWETSRFVLDGGYYGASVYQGNLRFSVPGESRQFTWEKIGDLGVSTPIDGTAC